MPAVAWEALPPEAAWVHPVADTRSPLSSLTFRGADGGLAIDGTLAAELPAVEARWTGGRAQAGLHAGAFMGFGTGGALTFDLYTLDGVFGAAVDAEAGPWAGRFGWTHTSAHYGDGVRKGDERPSNLDAWSREQLRMEASRVLGPARAWLRASALVHAIPEAPPLAVGAAAELAGPWRVAPYGAVEVELAQESGWSPAVDAQAGLWVRAARSRLRVALAGRTGPDDTGKAEGAPERWIGAVVGFDRTGRLPKPDIPD